MSPRPEAPGPMTRRGPRPLLLHLTLARIRSIFSGAISPNWNADWPNWSAEAIQLFIQEFDRGANVQATDAGFAASVAQETELIAGIAAYRRHPWRRDVQEPASIWSEGSSRILAYGHGGTPVLFVPSLINRSHILDLMADHSMMRWLADRGVRPFLLDWGWPGLIERRFTLTDYVAGRLERAMTSVFQAAGSPPVLLGYCMGGTLAVAAAQRRPDLISGIALLAAPWDFHSPDTAKARQAASMSPFLEPVLASSQTLPVDVLQALFAMMEPWGVAEKYRRFARIDQASEAAKLFVALEDWLNDGVPLAANVARTCLSEWYGENSPARAAWTVAGLVVDPSDIQVPAFVAVPSRDRIVPPESALPLARLIRGAFLHRPMAGHVGMVAGGRAEFELWQPLLNWLKGIA